MMNSRPLPVIILGCVYIVMGAVGFLYHLGELKPPMQQDAIWVEVVRLIAIVCGIYLLRGKDWARWLAVGWMALHVVVSLFHSTAQVVMHSLFLAVIVYLLFFRPQTARFFRGN